MPASRSARFSRILVIKWSALGDVAIASAAMQDLRLAFPQACLHLNTVPAARRLFHGDPRFEEVFAIDVRERGSQLRRAWQWLRRVHAGRYDLIVDLQRNDRTRMLLALLRLSGSRAEVWGHARVPVERSAPAILQHRLLLLAGGVPTPTRVPALHIPPAERIVARAALAQRGLTSGEYAVLLPGSQRGGRLKRWGAARYAELGRRLLAAGVQRIAIIGGPDEADDCRAIAAAIGPAAVHLDAPPLLQVPVLCEGACLVVANDTGLAHIAAAAARPMLVLCGPTDPRRVKPLGDAVVALQARTGCLNCYAKTCALDDEAACLAAIEPGAVAEFACHGVLDAAVQRF